MNIWILRDCVGVYDPYIFPRVRIPMELSGCEEMLLGINA